MVLAHVTNKLSSHVTHMTVQVFKDDWIRSSSTSKLNIPSLSTSNNVNYSNQGTPSTKTYSAPQPLNAPTGTRGNTNISSPRKASWLQNNNEPFSFNSTILTCFWLFLCTTAHSSAHLSFAQYKLGKMWGNTIDTPGMPDLTLGDQVTYPST